jgi:hypothetical protein
MSAAAATASLVAETDALRADLAACLRAAAGDENAGFEALFEAYMKRAEAVRRSFALSAIRAAALAEDEENGDAVALSAEVESLRRELADKEALLTKHSENLRRWSAETLSVQRESESLLDPGPPVPLRLDAGTDM